MLNCGWVIADTTPRPSVRLLLVCRQSETVLWAVLRGKSLEDEDITIFEHTFHAPEGGASDDELRGIVLHGIKVSTHAMSG